MVSYLRPWLFLFVIILGEMLLDEIKIAIKNSAEQNKIPKRMFNTQVFLRRKQLNHKVLRGSKREKFQGSFFIILSPTFY